MLGERSSDDFLITTDRKEYSRSVFGDEAENK